MEVNVNSSSTFVGHVMLMDTQREKDIYLGTEYPYDTLSSGQCLISSDMEDLMNISENQAIQLYMNITMTVTALMQNYNVLSAQNGWEPLTNTTFNYTVQMPCTVVGFLDETYAKYKDD